jgi:hypothetical protein
MQSRTLPQESRDWHGVCRQAPHSIESHLQKECRYSRSPQAGNSSAPSLILTSFLFVAKRVLGQARIISARRTDCGLYLVPATNSAWLSIIAFKNKTNPGTTIQNILDAHYATYGRNYFSRYDYEEVDSQGASEMYTSLSKLTCDPKFVGTVLDGYTVAHADDFSYSDPVDGSKSVKQVLPPNKGTADPVHGQFTDYSETERDWVTGGDCAAVCREILGGQCDYEDCGCGWSVG